MDNFLLFFFFREIRRVVYIPFCGESVTGRNHQEITSHIRLKDITQKGSLSSALGYIISLRKEWAEGMPKEITETLLTSVEEVLDGALPEVYLSYATLLWFTNKVDIFKNNKYFVESSNNVVIRPVFSSSIVELQP